MTSSCTEPFRSGTATVEALLVLSVIAVFFGLSPTIWRIWSNDQIARIEAHRDTFDKTTTFDPLTEILHTASSVIGQPQRRHILPGFPPDPSTVDEIRAFPAALPNSYVEGWQRQRIEITRGPLARDMELFRYGAVIRSPWTWLGYPFIPTQDRKERGEVVSWYKGKYDDTLDQNMKDALRLWKN